MRPKDEKMNHKGTKTIETSRLALRAFCESDAPAAFRNWTSDPQVTEFLRWKTHQTPEETAKIVNYWLSSYSSLSFYHWAIVPKIFGEPIGTISGVKINEEVHSVHIGYCIGSKWWHKGFTSEALSAVIRFFFDEVNANRIESQHDPLNPHSGEVMKKCGMQYEGTLRQADWSNKGIHDASVYAILKEEWSAKSTPLESFA